MDSNTQGRIRKQFVIVYLRSRASETEEILRQICSSAVDRAFRSAAFANMLDPHFYQCECDLDTLFATENLVRVSIKVVLDNKGMGAILVQMCTPAQLIRNDLESDLQPIRTNLACCQRRGF